VKPWSDQNFRGYKVKELASFIQNLVILAFIKKKTNQSSLFILNMSFGERIKKNSGYRKGGVYYTNFSEATEIILKQKSCNSKFWE